MDTLKFIPEASYFTEAGWKKRLKTLGKAGGITAAGAGANRMWAGGNVKDNVFAKVNANPDVAVGSDFMDQQRSDLIDSWQHGAGAGAAVAGLAFGAKRALQHRKNKKDQLNTQQVTFDRDKKAQELSDLKGLRQQNNQQARHNNNY